MQEWNALLVLTVSLSIIFSVFTTLRHMSWNSAADVHMEEWNRILEGKGQFRYYIEVPGIIPTVDNDADYHDLSDRLVEHQDDGKRKYYGRTRKTNNMVTKEDIFFGRNKLDVKSYDLGQLQKELRRDKRVKRSIFTYFNYAVIGTGVIVLIFLLPPIFVTGWRPRFDACYARRGGLLFKIICFVYFCLLLAGIGLCVLIETSDLNDRKGKLSRSLKIVAERFKNLNLNNLTAINCPQCNHWDTNGYGLVHLSPLSWFLIILECIMSEGMSIDEILQEAKIPKNNEFYSPIINLAKSRFKQGEPLVQIHGIARSYDWLNQLLFCPDNPGYRILSFELVGLLPRCIVPFVAFLFVWYVYYSQEHEPEVAATTGYIPYPDSFPPSPPHPPPPPPPPRVKKPRLSKKVAPEIQSSMAGEAGQSSLTEYFREDY